MSKKQTSVDWLCDKIKIHFEHDGDLLESFKIITSIAKQKERMQIEEAHQNGFYCGNDIANGVNPEVKCASAYYTQTYGECTQQ